MNPSVAKALQARDPLPLKRIATRCTEANAYAMDINLGPLRHNAAEIITFVIETVQEIFRGKLVLDSVQAEVLAAGIEACNTPPIINGFSLEKAKLKTILPLAAKHQADIIGFLLNEKGHVPCKAEERLEVASRLIAEAEEQDVPLERIIIDPVLVPLSWQDGTHYNHELLDIIHFLPQLFSKPVRTIAGLSNIGAGAPDRATRARAETSYILMLAALKLDYILMSSASKSNLNALHLTKLFMGEKIFTWQEIKDTTI
jgi:5-methyltetrahydrofolate corrinoid/iron sulfur protein methyltransferase